jgi:hypothetical protein
MSRIHKTYYHGVVSPDRIAFGGPLQSYAVVPMEIEPKVTRLLQLCESYAINRLWIAPDTTLSHCDPEIFKDANPEVWDIRYTETPPSHKKLPRMKRAIAWRREGIFEEKRSIEIIFSEQTSWEWTESDPLTLLQAIQAMEKDFAIPIDSHPGSVGRELMKWSVVKDSQIIPAIDLQKLPCKCARDFAWKRPIEEKGAWLHAYDKNSMYLSAASGAGLGIGNPTYYAGTNMKTPDMKLAGLWHIRDCVHIPGADKVLAPLYAMHTFAPWPLAEGQEWCTTPILKILCEMGYHVTLSEGYEWPITRRALGGAPNRPGWAETLWSWRAKYKADTSEAGAVKYASMKRIATASIGLLGHYNPTAPAPMRDRAFPRPDWWSTIIETAKARMLYNIDAFARDGFGWPCMVFVDCLYYVSDSPEPDQRFLQRQNELGGYKHKGVVPIDEYLLEWFAGDMSPAEVVLKINIRQEEEALYARFK